MCEPPNGEYSEAKCKYCGQVTKFPNSPKHITAWNRRASLEKGHGLSKTQLKKELAKKGEQMPDFHRELESESTKKERQSAINTK
jgi:hypothetical protein